MELSNDFKYLDIIERHEQGLLSEPEIAAFNDRLNSEPEFASEYEDYQQMISGIKRFNKLGMGDAQKVINVVNEKLNKEGFFEKVEKEVVQKAGSKKTIMRRMSGIRRLLAIAASLAIILVAYWWIGGKDNSKNLAELEGKSFQSAANFFIGKKSGFGSSDSTSLLMVEVVERLNKDDMDGALQLLESLKGKFGPENTRMRYLISLALYKQGKHQEVIDILIPLLDSDNSVVQQSARWFTALSYVRLDKIPKAKELLQEMLSEPSKEGTDDLQDAARTLLSFI